MAGDAARVGQAGRRRHLEGELLEEVPRAVQVEVHGGRRMPGSEDTLSEQTKVLERSAVVPGVRPSAANAI